VEHWLQEYKLDGFRFDLSKGFTQNTQCGGSPTNEACMFQYHADRIAIWKRYYDSCQLKSPGSYVILEHFAENSEEIELSNYGMLLWGNANFNFTEASMGYVMESHDEERMMYKNLQFGNSSGSYNIRDLNTGLKRIEMCAGFFLTAPGPKMIWEFGELGYDQSINRCVNGTIDPNCRLDNKPILWNYQQIIQRKRLYDVFTSLNKLRFHSWYKDVFIANNINLTRSLSGAFKSMTIRSATDSSMLCVIGNFDVTAQTGSFTFPSGGAWYDYLNGNTFTATGAAQNITLQPGEFHVYLNRNLTNVVITPVSGLNGSSNQLLAKVYPNPSLTLSVLDLYVPQNGLVQVDLLNDLGQKIKTIFSGTMTKGKHSLELTDKINNIPAGVYLLRVQSASKVLPVKLVKQ
jgi:hypothetical protein